VCTKIRFLGGGIPSSCRRLCSDGTGFSGCLVKMASGGGVHREGDKRKRAAAEAEDVGGDAKADTDRYPRRVPPHEASFS